MMAWMRRVASVRSVGASSIVGRSGTPRTTRVFGNSGVSNHCGVSTPPRVEQGCRGARGQTLGAVRRAREDGKEDISQGGLWIQGN